MTENARLTDFTGDGPTTRPAGEAEAVAGNGGTAPEVIDTSSYRYPDADGTIDIAVTQVDYTIEGSGSDEFPVLHVFGRTAENETEHVRVREFRPYFYAPTDLLDGPPEAEYDRLTGSEEGYESIRGESLTKIFGQTPRDVGQLRDRFEHYEADILFPNRLLIDADITSGVRVPERRAEDGSIDVPYQELTPVDVDADLRVITFDIETEDRHGFPENGEEPIICLTSHDSYDDQYIVWLYESPGGESGPDDLPSYEPISDEIAVDVRRFDSEEGMLAAFIEYLRETDGDVLTGWNFSEFDMPYFLDRLEHLGGTGDLDPDRLSRVNEVWRNDWQGPNVKGRVVFDLLYAYKRTQFTELDSYRLDAVGEIELGIGKERYPGNIGDLWEENPERLLEYNLRDVELCVELDRKQGIIPFWKEVATFAGCKLEDAPTPSDVVDIYLLHKVHNEFVLPSKGNQQTEEYEGGAVFDPITGVREMVSVLDLKCFDTDTDVLTPDGIRNIKELSVGDPVYTLNSETFECETKPVVETHQYENSFGELHHLKGNTHDFKVTENHRFLVSKKREWDSHEPTDFEFSTYQALPDTERFAFPSHEPMNGQQPETFDLIDEVEGGHVVVYYNDDPRKFRARMPAGVQEHLDLAHGSSAVMGLQKKVGKYLIPLDVYRNHREIIDAHADQVFLKFDRGHRETPLSFEMTDWLQLLGWYVTEGSINQFNNQFTLHQVDQDGRTAIQALLDRMKINYNVKDQGVTVSNRYLREWLIEQCGLGYANKQLPDWVFRLDGELLSVLFETMIQGDGSITDSGLRQFWTKNNHLKDAVTDLAVRCGEKPTVTKQSDGTWYVSIGKRGSFMKESNASVEQHDGSVYCVTVKDNHAVLAGRNGHFQWIGQSLYPMCMVTINASPETKVDPDYDGETYRAPNGARFRKDPAGIIREMVDELLAERDEKKQLRNENDPGSESYSRYDRQQAAVKIIMNSLYGVTGWERFRLYDKEMGAAVTATGREVIDYTEDIANEQDMSVVYGDTDSVMFEFGQDMSKADAIEQSFQLEDEINASYDEFARERLNAEQHRFQIEFEKLYRRFFQAGRKKRYAGHIIWKEGKDVDDIDITGFEYKRSDIAPITKEVQRRVIELIVTSEGDEYRDEVAEYVNGVIQQFQENELSVEEIGIPGGIGKRLSNYDTDTAHVRGAKYANTMLGTNFARGSKPKRVYLTRVHPEFFRRMEDEYGLDTRKNEIYREFKEEQDVICIEFADQLPEEFEIDRDKMLDKTLRGPIERILEAIGLSWDEIKTGQQQMGLEEFF